MESREALHHHSKKVPHFGYEIYYPGNRSMCFSTPTLFTQNEHINRYKCFPIKPDNLNLQSQSLSRSYGSNLPTSLTYIILSTRDSSPWRPAADIGTVC